MMKKSTFVLTAVALYLRRREQELDEYEKLLFSDEYDDEDEDDEQDDTASADAEPMADPDADGDISF